MFFLLNIPEPDRNFFFFTKLKLFEISNLRKALEQCNQFDFLLGFPLVGTEHPRKLK